MSNGFIQMCLQVPNLGTLLFYIIAVLLIPSAIVSTGNHKFLAEIYLPSMVMIAATLTTSGEPKLFANLYPEEPENISALLSKNFLNFLAIVGILVNTLVVGISTNNLVLGLISGLMGFIITFPVAGKVIPFFIHRTDIALKERTTFRFPGNWHKYFVGIVFIITFLSIQLLVLRLTKNIDFTYNRNNNTPSTPNNTPSTPNNKSQY